MNKVAPQACIRGVWRRAQRHNFWDLGKNLTRFPMSRQKKNKMSSKKTLGSLSVPEIKCLSRAKWRLWRVPNQVINLSINFYDIFKKKTWRFLLIKSTEAVREVLGNPKHFAWIHKLYKAKIMFKRTAFLRKLFNCLS